MDILGIAKSLIKPIAGVISKRTERKVNRDTIKGKLAQGKQDNEQAVTLTDAEWETVGQSMQDKTWKDEFAVVVFLSPIILFLCGGVASAFGEPRVLEGMATAVTAMAAADIDLGFLIEAVTLSAIGLKLWRA